MQQSVITIKSSKQFILLKIGIFSGSLFCLINLPLQLAAKILLIIILIIYSLYSFFKAPVLLSLNELSANVWQLVTSAGTFTGELYGDSTVTPWVCVLRFFIPEVRKKYTFIIFNDAMDKNSYRRLLVRLYAARKLL
jgi:hypothetical protein